MKNKNLHAAYSAMRWSAVAMATTAALLATSAHAATSWDATADFDPSNNPSASGAWSYGWMSTLGGTFTLFTNPQHPLVSFYTWNSSVVDPQAMPTIGKSIEGAAWYTVLIEPNTLHAHPGPSGEYAVLRFTSPTAGNFNVSASFFGQDDAGPTSSDVHVRTNSGDLFSDSVSGFGPSSLKSWSSMLNLAAGQTVDFAVGYGSNRSYFYDSTGMTATVTAVPEPATMAMMITGLAGIAARRRREKQA